LVVAVAGSKKKRSKTGSGWSWRLAGIALCAFFALGVITGLSQSGRVLARRIQTLFQRLPHSGHSDLIPTAYHTFFFKEPTAENFGQPSAASTLRARADAIALVEHPDGFYQIDSEGGLRGPVSPADTADLPVLSGSAVENAPAPQLVEYAGQLIRAEAILSAIISEMRVTSSGEMSLFLERPQLVIALAPGQFPLQLARAARVLDVWRGHRELIGIIDMTTPSEAIVQPKAETMERLGRVTGSGAVSRPG
jgi:cell division protein FtsQ